MIKITIRLKSGRKVFNRVLLTLSFIGSRIAALVFSSKPFRFEVFVQTNTNIKTQEPEDSDEGQVIHVRREDTFFFKVDSRHTLRLNEKPNPMPPKSASYFLI